MAGRPAHRSEISIVLEDASARGVIGARVERVGPAPAGGDAGPPR
ncbi:hypothetical protein [Sorangium sp. So ce854]